jgi:hypothetical protein
MSREEQAVDRTACCGRLRSDPLKSTLHGTRPRKRLNLKATTSWIPTASPTRGHRRGPRRRCGEPLERALLLAARQEQRLGRGRSVARALESVQDRDGRRLAQALHPHQRHQRRQPRPGAPSSTAPACASPARTSPAPRAGRRPRSAPAPSPIPTPPASTDRGALHTALKGIDMLCRRADLRASCEGAFDELDERDGPRLSRPAVDRVRGRTACG